MNLEGAAFYPIEVRYAKPEPIESDLSEGFKLRVDFFGLWADNPGQRESPKSLNGVG